VTAAGARSQDDDQGGDVDRLCQMAVDGRRAVRALAHWSALLQFSDAELQILWGLRLARVQGVDQTTLATRLALSPALVSSCVEKLRRRGLIACQQAGGDRRRHLWQLSAGGWEALQLVLQLAGQSREAAA
jgi:DNA-binding MarR family transcriptional regulator